MDKIAIEAGMIYIQLWYISNAFSSFSTCHLSYSIGFYEVVKMLYGYLLGADDANS